MKKTLTYLFQFNLVIWFITSIYLSLNSIVNIFTNTDPYIAKFLSALSFIIVTSIGIRNYYKTGEFVEGKEQTIRIGNGNQIPKKTCKACKAKRNNGNV